MLAKLHDKAFNDPDWIFEIKWDGYRAIAEIKGNNSRLYSRNGLSFEKNYPIVVDALSNIEHNCILDGEIVALDDSGVPRFQLLQQYGTDADVPLKYYVFDLLSLDGKSTEGLPLSDRKELLKKLLPKDQTIVYCDHVKEDGIDFFNEVKKVGLEGMIAKRWDSTYHENSRGGDWLKIKHMLTDEAVIAGFTAPRGGRKYFGALVLGAFEEGKLKYIGHTGTGFDDKTLKSLYDQLKPLITDTNPFGLKVKVNSPVTWVKPKLVCAIKFTEITSDGNRRHPVFEGLRTDKSPKDVKLEAPVATEKTEPVTAKNSTMKTLPDTGTKKVNFTNTDKIFWPDEGYTKGDVIDYYNRMYKYILPYLKNRPESLKRNPNGINGQFFYHKDAGEHAPDWVETFKVHSESNDKDIDYIVCNDKPTLLYLANLGCIEMNPWNSRTTKPDNPDYCILDLDPSDNNTFDQVVQTALAVKEVLDRAGVESYCKTSGSTGLHVYIPLGAKYDYEQCRQFALIIAQMTNDLVPDFTTLERSLSKRRKDQLYIDYLQNKKGQTLAAAYSIRPKPGATVSTPLDWKEVKFGLDPHQFNINTIQQRVEKKGDLWLPVLKKGIDMRKTLGLL
ncbi:DNA ligase D [Taibaiella soli]|uniref:DNA ligase (ATP) n=1 Tax=Taibaiella soli TaxID=1649169 RepID=A0A2W2BM74_9BACT|nr:DNA ligase D [Taibaiella soli]PZF74546.1 DNA ligase D [Taibaiella soli]